MNEWKRTFKSFVFAFCRERARHWQSKRRSRWTRKKVCVAHSMNEIGPPSCRTIWVAGRLKRDRQRKREHSGMEMKISFEFMHALIWILRMVPWQLIFYGWLSQSFSFALSLSLHRFASVKFKMKKRMTSIPGLWKCFLHLKTRKRAQSNTHKHKHTKRKCRSEVKKIIQLSSVLQRCILSM